MSTHCGSAPIRTDTECRSRAFLTLLTEKWVLWAALAALCIHWQETIYRLATGLYKLPFVDGYLFPNIDTYFSLYNHLWLQPSYLLAGVGLFYCFRKEPMNPRKSFLASWAVFIFFIVLSRSVITAVHTGEPWNTTVILGLAALVYGLYLTTQREPFRLTDNSSTKVATGLALTLLCSVVAGTQHSDLLATTIAAAHPQWWMLLLGIAAGTIALWENIAFRAKFPRYLPVWCTRENGKIHLHLIQSWRGSMWPTLLPLSLVMNGALFYGYRDAVPSFMYAWGIYTLWDVTFRVLNNKILKEPFYVIHAVGMLLVVAGTWLSYLGTTE